MGTTKADVEILPRRKEKGSNRKTLLCSTRRTCIRTREKRRAGPRRQHRLETGGGIPEVNVSWMVPYYPDQSIIRVNRPTSIPKRETHDIGQQALCVGRPQLEP